MPELASGLVPAFVLELAFEQVPESARELSRVPEPALELLLAPEPALELSRAAYQNFRCQSYYPKMSHQNQ